MKTPSQKLLVSIAITTPGFIALLNHILANMIVVIWTYTLAITLVIILDKYIQNKIQTKQAIKELNQTKTENTQIKNILQHLKEQNENLKQAYEGQKRKVMILTNNRGTTQ